MSAYIVEREHVVYMIQAASELGVGGLKNAGGEVLAFFGNMLWQECIKSVKHRYPDDADDELPGPIDENFVITAEDFSAPLRQPLNLAQVFKSCDCYNYQSCEHPDWKASSAHDLIERLRDAAMRATPGYEEAEWGAPCQEPADV